MFRGEAIGMESRMVTFIMPVAGCGDVSDGNVLSLTANSGEITR